MVILRSKLEAHIFLIIFFCSSISCFGQVVNFRKDKYWLEAGLGGYSSIDSVGGISYSLSANLNSNSVTYKIRYLKHVEYSFLKPRPAESYHCIAMLIGKGYDGKAFHIYFSAGVGMIAGVRRGRFLYTVPSAGWFDLSDGRAYEKEHFHVFSIPLEVDLKFKPLEFAALGFTLFGELNMKRPMFGLEMTVGVGKLR